MSLSYADQQRIAYTLGIFAQPGLATGYPALVGKLDRIYADRVAKLPWVPPTWLAAVREVQAKNPGDLMRPTPGYNALGARGAEAPSFADTDEKLKVWHTIYNVHNDAIVAYAKKMQEEGASKLAGLYADAAFWDGAYKLAKVARDLPANIASGTANVFADTFAQFLPESIRGYAKVILWALGILIIVSLIIVYRKKFAVAFKGLAKKAKVA
jgi:hypothetical protein